MENIEFKIDRTNVEQRKAFELVANTNTSLFITGKAGTGKSTFIKIIQEEIDKNFLVLAPTGIAALNVEGQTIHSFFGFPLEVVCPGTGMEVSLEKRTVLLKVDTIIIDEASMVRADLVDGMDRFLRALMKTNLPFGGKQMLFVGDLYQLPPVVKMGTIDEELLRRMYGDGVPYFYKADVLRRMNLPKIEFQHVYRQTDETFLDILNRMRVGKTSQADLDILNKHIGTNEDVEDFAVTLTAYNKMAENINVSKLAEIGVEEHIYEAVLDGKFRIQDAPVPQTLRLKVGAQVIFCRNDFPRGVVNGTIAKVVELNDNNIKVVLKDGRTLNVAKMTWETKESVYNEEEQKVESVTVGSFTQYPLKLAWAITVHKSQGMTFDRMHFDLTRGTFLPGQAYVAISRMRTLEGLTLSKPICAYHIMPNAEVMAFANSFNDVELIDEELAFGQVFYKYLVKKDYDNAALACLHQALAKIKKGDCRNAALVAKRMYDVMLDDECLMGTTKGIPLMKDCSMTCNFLNAMLCLYSGRFDEAIGFVDLVLARRTCREALFIKGSALYRLGRFEESAEVCQQIFDAAKASDDKMPADKKQYLFEMKLNEKLKKSNFETCKHLMSRCPEYLPAYSVMRKEALSNNMMIEIGEEEENMLVLAFNDNEVSAEEFEQKTKEANVNSVEFRLFSRRVRKIKEGTC